MKYMFWAAGMVGAGIFGLVFIVMFENLTVNNESEYYVLKEAMEAAMLESVDLACFRNSNISDGSTGACNGSVKISEQKFVENFTRRYVQSVGSDVASYKLEFYDIIESPPKATVKIVTTSNDYRILNTDPENFKILNDLSGIIEAKDWGYNS